MKKIFCIAIILFCLSSCRNIPDKNAVFTSNTENVQYLSAFDSQTEKVKISYPVFGIHSTKFVNSSDFSSFGNYMKNMNFVSSDFNINNKFTSDFILKCFAQNVNPIVSVKYSDSTADIIKFAKSTKETNIKTCYNIFPLRENLNPEKYSDNYKTMYSILKKYSPQCKIIWTFDCFKDLNYKDYIPNEDCFDYIGIECVFDNAYDNIDTIEKLNSVLDILQNYNKPVILFFAVSHYDGESHRYEIEGAEKFIEYFYKYYAPYKENIYAVIYIDENNINKTCDYLNANDYSISNTEELSRTLENITNN